MGNNVEILILHAKQFGHNFMNEIRNEINLLLEKSYAIRINNLNESINLTNKALGLCNENKIDDLILIK